MTQQQQKAFINFVVFHVTRNVSERFSLHKISMETEEYFTKDGKLFSAYSTAMKNRTLKNVENVVRRMSNAFLFD